MKERRKRHPSLKAKGSEVDVHDGTQFEFRTDVICATGELRRSSGHSKDGAREILNSFECDRNPKQGIRIGHDLFSRLAYFSSSPKSKHAAEVLLESIPKDDEQQTVLIELGDSLCDGESLTDMQSLARIGEILPQNLARAVLIVPEKLPAYVAYALTSIQDPHSDYAVQMQIVCRTRHAEFIGSVGELASDKKTLFVKRVFSPETCKALFLPEAE